tara:strand:+ start:75 stop:1043 length:969 start_codon:yes stop_codon:yes gene_type:complete
MNGFSIIIPTWNRSKLLFKIVEICLKNKDIFDKFEILICDSHSQDNTKNLKKIFKVKYIRHLHSKKNNISAKRNLGIKKSRYEKLIFFDDDCIPNSKLLNEFRKNLDNIKTKNCIFFGRYFTDKKRVKTSNYHSYRNFKNFEVYKDFSLKKKLKFNNVITGNMGFIKNRIIKKNIFFSENLYGYGCEDVEWAFRLEKYRFKLLLMDAGCLHNETSKTFSNYLKKWTNMIAYSVPTLKKINYRCYSKMKFKMFEKKIFSNKLILFLIKKIYNFSLFLLIRLDKNKIFRIYSLYNLLVFCACIIGSSEKKNIKNLNKWMNLGYK